MNAVGFLECINTPQSGCLTSPGFLFPFVMLVLLVGIGFVGRRIDVQAFRRSRRRALQISSALLAISIATIAYFFAFEPDTIKGIETSPVAQTIWAVAISGFGAAFAFFAGALGLALGGWLAKKPKPARIASRPTNLVIAIDGPAASGKGTLAKKIATHFGLPCLDTGLLYRAVARDCVRAGHELIDASAAVAAAKALDAGTLDDPALRGPAAGDAASMVARIPEVRSALLAYQRTFAAQPGGAVLDGRDIGTVVCPDATVKIFVTASPEERARRRHLEHQARGENVAYETILEDIRRRDARDSGRDIAPMEPAPDAMRLDTTELNANAAFAAALKLVQQRLKTA